HMQAIAAPIRRTGNLHGYLLRFFGTWTVIRNAEAVRLTGNGVDQHFAGLYGFALLARPSAELALPGARAEIAVVLRVAQRLHLSFRPDLTMQVIPMKYHCGARVRQQLASLARAIVGIEKYITLL